MGKIKKIFSAVLLSLSVVTVFSLFTSTSANASSKKPLSFDFSLTKNCNKRYASAFKQAMKNVNSENKLVDFNLVSSKKSKSKVGTYRAKDNKWGLTPPSKLLLNRKYCDKLSKKYLVSFAMRLLVGQFIQENDKAYSIFTSEKPLVHLTHYDVDQINSYTGMAVF
ncbi:hypothetical protein LNP07_04645 [Apilactobacillus sp. M161]|uniref:Uncharacterized protein n=1 Tax=Apilactobacillus xinyiensis TaxID=2841032 RepID=A0ABT0I251_9LACO|nr:hypothetical protein [Apilactobacillus xinyiensis]MCK8624800.1 hypothetical protein [Apilactobacillus xinyiensis]